MQPFAVRDVGIVVCIQTVVLTALAGRYTGCRVVVTHQAVIENEEDGTEVAVCDPVVWSRVWPELRQFYG